MTVADLVELGRLSWLDDEIRANVLARTMSRANFLELESERWSR
jgi:hypothetical protein